MRKYNINNPKSQVFIVLFVTILIALVSGVHRTLISLLYGFFSDDNAANSIYSYTNHVQAPLMIWLALAFTVAPFGLAKAITDYYAGKFSKTKNVLFFGIAFYLFGVFTISLLLFSPPDLQNVFAQFMLPLSSGLIGAGEGFFFASVQILLSNYASGRQRGQFLGFSEFSIYGGYTVGSIIGGFLSQGGDYLIPYLFSFFIIFLTIILNYSVLREYKSVISSVKNNEEHIDVEDEEIETEKTQRKAKFKPKKLMKNKRILAVLIGTHLSKWGDALILMLPIYLAFILSPTVIIVPDTVKISLLLGIYTSTWALGMFFTSYLTENVGRRFPIIFGLLLSGIGFISISFISRGDLFVFESMSISMVLSGLGTGLYYPLLPALGLDIAKPKYQAQTLALFRSIRDFGYFTGPIVLAVIIWLSGSTINNLVVASTFTGIIMILISIIFFVILRETRPSWPFYDEFVSHAFTINKTVEKSVKAFDLKFINKNQPEKILSLVISANSLEKKADKKKRNLMKYLTISVRKTDDISEFFSLIRLIDEIGSKTSMAAFKYSKLNHLYHHIPKSIFESLNKLANSLLPMMEELLGSISLLDDQMYLTVKKQKSISSFESETDRLYDFFLKNLYNYEFFYQENEKFTIMMTLKEVGENLEKASDLMQDVGDLLSLIALKHRL